MPVVHFVQAWDLTIRTDIRGDHRYRVRATSLTDSSRVFDDVIPSDSSDEDSPAETGFGFGEPSRPVITIHEDPDALEMLLRLLHAGQPSPIKTTSESLVFAKLVAGYGCQKVGAVRNFTQLQLRMHAAKTAELTAAQWMDLIVAAYHMDFKELFHRLTRDIVHFSRSGGYVIHGEWEHAFSRDDAYLLQTQQSSIVKEHRDWADKIRRFHCGMGFHSPFAELRRPLEECRDLDHMPIDNYESIRTAFDQAWNSFVVDDANRNTKCQDCSNTAIPDILVERLSTDSKFSVQVYPRAKGLCLQSVVDKVPSPYDCTCTGGPGDDRCGQNDEGTGEVTPTSSNNQARPSKRRRRR